MGPEGIVLLVVCFSCMLHAVESFARGIALRKRVGRVFASSGDGFGEEPLAQDMSGLASKMTAPLFAFGSAFPVHAASFPDVDVSLDMTDFFQTVLSRGSTMLEEASKPGGLLNYNAPEITQGQWEVFVAALLGYAYVLDARQADVLLRQEVSATAKLVAEKRSDLEKARAEVAAADLEVSQESKSVEQRLHTSINVINFIKSELESVEKAAALNKAKMLDAIEDLEAKKKEVQAGVHGSFTDLTETFADLSRVDHDLDKLVASMKGDFESVKAFVKEQGYMKDGMVNLLFMQGLAKELARLVEGDGRDIEGVVRSVAKKGYLSKAEGRLLTQEVARREHASCLDTKLAHMQETIKLGEKDLGALDSYSSAQISQVGTRKAEYSSVEAARAELLLDIDARKKELAKLTKSAGLSSVGGARSVVGEIQRLKVANEALKERLLATDEKFIEAQEASREALDEAKSRAKALNSELTGSKAGAPRAPRAPMNPTNPKPPPPPAPAGSFAAFLQASQGVTTATATAATTTDES